MGLDSMFRSVPADFIRDQPTVDMSLENVPCVETIKEWRKFGELHNWFHNRYKFLGGKTDDFNCAYLRVFEHDVEMLLQDMKSGNMPGHSGFFFGDNDPWKRESAIEYFEQFLKEADWKRFGYLYSAWY